LTPREKRVWRLALDRNRGLPLHVSSRHLKRISLFLDLAAPPDSPQCFFDSPFFFPLCLVASRQPRRPHAFPSPSFPEKDLRERAFHFWRLGFSGEVISDAPSPLRFCREGDGMSLAFPSESAIVSPPRLFFAKR